MKRVSKKIIENYNTVTETPKSLCSHGTNGHACKLHSDCNEGLHCNNNKCKTNVYTCQNGTKKDGNPKKDSQGELIRSDLEWCDTCNNGFKKIDKDGNETTSNEVGNKCIPTKWICSIGDPDIKNKPNSNKDEERCINCKDPGYELNHENKCVPCATVPGKEHISSYKKQGKCSINTSKRCFQNSDCPNSSSGEKCFNKDNFTCQVNQCKTGYKISLNGNDCVATKYTCSNGIAVSGRTGSNKDEEKCAKCNTGYTLSNEKCIKKCFCKKNGDPKKEDVGTPASGLECKIGNTNVCIDCSLGYYLDNKQCKECSSIIKNGTKRNSDNKLLMKKNTCEVYNPGSSDACKIGYKETNKKCDSCEPGYKIVKNECIPFSKPSIESKCAEPFPLKERTADNQCKICDPNYELKYNIEDLYNKGETAYDNYQFKKLNGFDITLPDKDNNINNNFGKSIGGWCQNCKFTDAVILGNKCSDPNYPIFLKLEDYQSSKSGNICLKTNDLFDCPDGCVKVNSACKIKGTNLKCATHGLAALRDGIYTKMVKFDKNGSNIHNSSRYNKSAIIGKCYECPKNDTVEKYKKNSCTIEECKEEYALDSVSNTCYHCTDEAKGTKSNGWKNPGVNCQSKGSSYCKDGYKFHMNVCSYISCEDGYYSDRSSNTCEKCPNDTIKGTQVWFPDCRARSCKTGYTKSSATNYKCTSCDSGYRKIGDTCHPWGGYCDNGKLIELHLRTKDNHCGSCNKGFYLNKNNKCSNIDKSTSGTYPFGESWTLEKKYPLRKPSDITPWWAQNPSKYNSQSSQGYRVLGVSSHHFNDGMGGNRLCVSQKRSGRTIEDCVDIAIRDYSWNIDYDRGIYFAHQPGHKSDHKYGQCYFYKKNLSPSRCNSQYKSKKWIDHHKDNDFGGKSFGAGPLRIYYLTKNNLKTDWL